MSKTNQPTHHVFQVRDGEEKSFWTRIGAAWPHNDGKGFSIQLTCFPVDGRLTVRERDQDEGQGNAE